MIYCLNQSAYGRYESPFNLKPKEDGVGTFVWPNGQRTVCWFYEGSLMLSHTMSANELVDFELTEEKRKFEKYKKEEEDKWKDSHQNQIEEERQRVAKEKEEKEETFRKWMEEEKKKQTDELSKARSAFEEEKEKAHKFITANKGPIKLNIGGNLFQTTLSNLSKFPSMLNTMFNGMLEVEKDESGAVFIDRDGTHFRHILNFMRDESLSTDLPAEVIGALKTEAEFYQMADLTNALNNLNKDK